MLAECLIGQKFARIEFGSDEVLFYGEDGEPAFKMFHDQDCCESVEIRGVTVDGKTPSEIVAKRDEGIVIISAKECEPDLPAMSCFDDSFLWTVYGINTTEGFIIITWYGTSNGYYGEAPTIARKTENGWSTWE